MLAAGRKVPSGQPVVILLVASHSTALQKGLSAPTSLNRRAPGVHAGSRSPTTSR